MVYIIVELMKRIFSLSLSKGFWFTLGVISLCIGSYYAGRDKAYSEYQNTLQIQREHSQRALKRLQEENQEKEDEIVKKYLTEIDKLKQMNEDISNAKIKDTIECPTVTSDRVQHSKTNTDNNSRRLSKDKSKSNLLCYTESQLRDKIKKSLDIARECDALAIKYNSLYEVCTK